MLTMPLVSVENLSKVYSTSEGWGIRGKQHEVKAVDSVSFNIEAGETLGLVGESGCGKTTLGRMILRLVEPTSGRIWFDGQDVTAAAGKDMRRLRRHMQIVFQDPVGSLNPECVFLKS
jgi:ABC-type oligopeptide transport system ATPase subunit